MNRVKYWQIEYKKAEAEEWFPPRGRCMKKKFEFLNFLQNKSQILGVPTALYPHFWRPCE